jgi:hypothetical protein
VINVAELFAPNIAPGIAGRLYILDRDPWQMRCVAEWLSPMAKIRRSTRRMLGRASWSKPPAGERRAGYRLLSLARIQPE